MKNFLCLLVLFTAACASEAAVQPGKGLFYQPVTPAQYGTVRQEKFYSASLKRDWPYSVYYPAGYEEGSKKYPVIYLLHGLTDSHRSWIELNSSQLMLDKAIAAKVIPPSVVIFPEGLEAWYADTPATAMRTAFTNDLFPYAETNFRLINRRSARAIGGQSMGGHGTLIFSMLKPDYFASAAALSPAVTALGKPPVPGLIAFMKTANLTRVYGDPFSQAKWDEYSYHPAYQSYLQQSNRVAFFVANGGSDYVTPAEDSQALVADMKKDGLAVEYWEVPFAVHSWTFWTLLWEPMFIFFGKHLSDRE